MRTDQFRAALASDTARKLTLGLAQEAVDASHILSALYVAVRRHRRGAL